MTEERVATAKRTRTPAVAARPIAWRERWNGYLFCGLLCLAVVVIYWPVLNYPFVNYDDRTFVVDNPAVQQGLSGASLRWAFSSLFIYWQPLTWISYMLDHSFYGLNPRGYHATNLLLHLANTMLVFVVFNRMTGRFWSAAVIAAAFGLHPINVESVAWIAERKGLLCAFFWLLALLMYLRYVEQPRAMRFLWVILFFGLSLMAKSMAVTFPCVLLLLDYWPLRRWAGNAVAQWPALHSKRFAARTPRQLVVEKLPLFLLSALSSILTIEAQKGMGAVISMEMLPLSRRMAQTVFCYGAYIKKLFWPVDLAVFYPNPGAWPARQIAVAALLLAAITGMTVWQARRRPYTIVGWLWLVGMLLPVIGLFQTGEQAMADRYAYLPALGIFIMVAWAMTELLGQTNSGRVALGIGGFAAVWACAAVSTKQLRVWQDTQALFEHANAVTANNYFAQTVLGTLAVDAGKPQQAIDYFNAALKVQPFYALTHFGLARALMVETNYEGAIHHLRTALQHDGGNVEAHFLLARAFQETQQLDAAASEYREVLRLRPGSAEAEFYLGSSLHALHRDKEALDHYRNAVQSAGDLKQGNATAVVGALNDAAWILATSPDTALRNGAEAVRLAERACGLTGRKVPILLGTLAAAYAEQGSFAEAIRTAEEAHDLAAASGEKELAERNAQLLEMYRAGKAFHEP